MADYKESGVDVEEGYRAVDKYREQTRRTRIPGQLSDIGSFSGMFAVPRGIKDPVMVSGTDGVGTKLDIAFRMKKYDTVGIDCVAMSVNDILCSGVQPLFFLDYIACGSLDSNIAAALVKGVADGCVDAGCALLGGETAEMPGFYDAGKYDLAGFAVGVASRKKLIDGGRIRQGDVLVGLSSSGVHSNGFSLVRRLVTDLYEKVSIDGVDRAIGEVLLTPTRIYVKPVMDIIQRFPGSVHGMCHITGGGFYENIPRMFPKAEGGGKQLAARVKRGSWKIPDIFSVLVEKGADRKSLYNTFNMGIGFVMCVAKQDAGGIIDNLNSYSQKHKIKALSPMKAYRIGFVDAIDAVEGDLKGNPAMVRIYD